MRLATEADWPGTPEEARALQLRLAARVDPTGGPATVRLVAGVDGHHDERRGLSFAAATLMTFPGLELVQSVLAAVPLSFPYRTGLLSFREAPAALLALRLLDEPPDLLLVDGQGIAHPRGLGIAAHLGVLLSWPTVGIAKSRLTGDAPMPGPAPGERTPLVHRGHVIGAVVRTRARSRPLWISVGHKIGLERAVELTLACCRGHRLPEPTHEADRLSRCHS